MLILYVRQWAEKVIRNAADKLQLDSIVITDCCKSCINLIFTFSLTLKNLLNKSEILPAYPQLWATYFKGFANFVITLHYNKLKYVAVVLFTVWTPTGQINKGSGIHTHHYLLFFLFFYSLDMWPKVSKFFKLSVSSSWWQMITFSHVFVFILKVDLNVSIILLFLKRWVSCRMHTF